MNQSWIVLPRRIRLCGHLISSDDTQQLSRVATGGVARGKKSPDAPGERLCVRANVTGREAMRDEMARHTQQ